MVDSFIPAYSLSRIVTLCCVIGSIALKATPSAPNLSHFDFSRYIAFVMHLDTTQCLDMSKAMYLEKPKRFII
jgi:hypothetical protein